MVGIESIHVESDLVVPLPWSRPKAVGVEGHASESGSMHPLCERGNSRERRPECSMR